MTTLKKLTLVGFASIAILGCDATKSSDNSAPSSSTLASGVTRQAVPAINWTHLPSIAVVDYFGTASGKHYSVSQTQISGDGNYYQFSQAPDAWSYYTTLSTTVEIDGEMKEAIDSFQFDLHRGAILKNGEITDSISRVGFNPKKLVQPLADFTEAELPAIDGLLCTPKSVDLNRPGILMGFHRTNEGYFEAIRTQQYESRDPMGEASLENGILSFSDIEADLDLGRGVGMLEQSACEIDYIVINRL